MLNWNWQRVWKYWKNCSGTWERENCCFRCRCSCQHWVNWPVMYRCTHGLLPVLQQGGVVIYFAALMSSHLAAFRVESNIRKESVRRIVHMPLGFFDINTSGKIRKVIDDNAGVTHSFIAHRTVWRVRREAASRVEYCHRRERGHAVRRGRQRSWSVVEAYSPVCLRGSRYHQTWQKAAEKNTAG